MIIWYNVSGILLDSKSIKLKVQLAIQAFKTIEKVSRVMRSSPLKVMMLPGTVKSSKAQDNNKHG